MNPGARHASPLNYHDYGVAKSGDLKLRGRIQSPMPEAWPRLWAKAS